MASNNGTNIDENKQQHVPPKQQGDQPLKKKLSNKRLPAPWKLTPHPPLDSDCDRPACSEISEALQRQGFDISSLGGGGGSSGGLLNRNMVATNNKQCPPNSAELGNGTWKLLHSMAAWYPDQPSKEDRNHMSNFIAALARFYPCTWCAQDFQANLEQSPVKTETRKDLCTWLCEQHNLVNEKLGKPVFPCDMQSLDERWRKSNDPRCGNHH